MVKICIQQLPLEQSINNRKRKVIVYSRSVDLDCQFWSAMI